MYVYRYVYRERERFVNTINNNDLIYILPDRLGSGFWVASVPRTSSIIILLLLWRVI